MEKTAPEKPFDPEAATDADYKAFEDHSHTGPFDPIYYTPANPGTAELLTMLGFVPAPEFGNPNRWHNAQWDVDFVQPWLPGDGQPLNGAHQWIVAAIYEAGMKEGCKRQRADTAEQVDHTLRLLGLT